MISASRCMTHIHLTTGIADPELCPWISFNFDIFIRETCQLRFRYRWWSNDSTEPTLLDPSKSEGPSSFSSWMGQVNFDYTQSSPIPFKWSCICIYPNNIILPFTDLGKKFWSCPTIQNVLTWGQCILQFSVTIGFGYLILDCVPTNSRFTHWLHEFLPISPTIHVELLHPEDWINHVPQIARSVRHEYVPGTIFQSYCW